VPLKPVLQAILLADAVYTDVETGKRVIAGVFDNIAVKQFPTEHQRQTWVYLSFTDIRGKVAFSLRYVDLLTNEVLMDNGPNEIECGDPLATLDGWVPLPFIPLPHPGVYALEVHSCDELIGALRITAAAQAEENSHA
jgi:hypothetical protein